MVGKTKPVNISKLVKSVLHYDKLSLSSGVWTAKAGYYYRHGQSPETIATEIKTKLRSVGLTTEIISGEDQWRAWPKDSYFIVKFKVKK